MPKVLIVEDDAGLARALQLALTTLGHQVDTVPTGEDALSLLAVAAAPDLLVVDVMLPGIDGFELCRRVTASLALPIVLLTARSDSVDVVVGLECGADDYIVKPVEPRVLDARIKAVLRRAGPASPAVSTPRPGVGQPPRRPMTIGPIEFDEPAMRVTRAGVELRLTATEVRLLAEFARHRDQVLDRRTLLELVWDYDYSGDVRLVDACVQRLRAKIEPDPGRPTLITTVRGIGYRLEGP